MANAYTTSQPTNHNCPTNFSTKVNQEWTIQRHCNIPQNLDTKDTERRVKHTHTHTRSHAHTHAPTHPFLWIFISYNYNSDKRCYWLDIMNPTEITYCSILWYRYIDGLVIISFLVSANCIPKSIKMKSYCQTSQRNVQVYMYMCYIFLWVFNMNNISKAFLNYY